MNALKIRDIKILFYLKFQKIDCLRIFPNRYKYDFDGLLQMNLRPKIQRSKIQNKTE